jgi:hypothetical protein
MKAIVRSISSNCRRATFAKSEAEAAIKTIDLDDAQMKNLTDSLEAKIHTTTSWGGGKIRNRRYITLMQQTVKDIVADVKQKIA